VTRTARISIKAAPVLDNVFFHKSQVRMGSTFINVGRLEPGTRWRVTGIVSYTPTVTGRYRRDNVQVVRKLSDDVTMTRMGGREHRTATFVYLSYSSIWQLEK
jgi:hypothetical protein